MSRGRTTAGRARATRALLETPSARPLVRGVDHGDDLRVTGALFGASSERWIEPFLEANRNHLQRLDLQPHVDTRGGLSLRLTPGARIGAIPLVSPATRRVSAGLLVTPRFRWGALGAVLGELGFAVEPSLGGSALVPGSAREVPAWILAAPVIRRLDDYLSHRRRGFVVREAHRTSPRGQVDWSAWARRDVPAGRWASLPCRFPDPDDDPTLLSAVRWTLDRLGEELAPHRDASPARALLTRVADLHARIGPGAAVRPAHGQLPLSSGWAAEATEAMGWVADERGLGGSLSLDGMSWDLAIDVVWEAWVDAFVQQFGREHGLAALRRGHTERRLNWSTPTRSMGSLVPDTGLRGADRIVWVDAKYKAHLQLIASRGWQGLHDDVRAAHRADLHQALAYASLDDVARVDSLLVYPALGGDAAVRPAVATVAVGRRRVRLALVGLPFGFTSEDQRRQTVASWRELLAA